MNTPGPWIVVENPKDINAIFIHTPDEEIIATAWSLFKRDGGCPSTDNRANAYLISASPELLELLIEAEHDVRQGVLPSDDWLKNAKSVISKAKKQ